MTALEHSQPVLTPLQFLTKDYTEYRDFSRQRSEQHADPMNNSCEHRSS